MGDTGRPGDTPDEPQGSISKKNNSEKRSQISRPKRQTARLPNALAGSNLALCLAVKCGQNINYRPWLSRKNVGLLTGHSGRDEFSKKGILRFKMCSSWLQFKRVIKLYIVHNIQYKTIQISLTNI